MEEETHEVHRKLTPGQRKQRTLERVKKVEERIAEFRKQVERGEISWEEFDSRVARSMVARERHADLLRRRSFKDRLTGLPNRRLFDLVLQREIEEAKRLEKPLGILIFDIDNFKKEVNDKYGHPVGDEVLRFIAKITQAHTRKEDLLTRYGGEEFAVLVIAPKEDTLEEIADRLRGAVEETSIEGLPKVTISVGGAYYKPGEDLKSVIEKADKALYNSKEEGRNRVTIS